MISKKWSGCLAAIGFVVLTAVALPQSKDDFERASRETKGCDLIPYYGLMRDCRTTYGTQTEWCTGEKGKGCADLSKAEKEEARKRLENAETCLTLRKKVVAIYDEALDRLWRENKDDIKPFVDIITKKIVESQRGHRIAIEGTEGQIKNCKELL